MNLFRNRFSGGFPEKIVELILEFFRGYVETAQASGDARNFQYAPRRFKVKVPLGDDASVERPLNDGERAASKRGCDVHGSRTGARRNRHFTLGAMKPPIYEEQQQKNAEDRKAWAPGNKECSRCGDEKNIENI